MIYTFLVYSQVIAIIFTSGHVILSTTLAPYLYMLFAFSSLILFGYRILIGVVKIDQKIILYAFLVLIIFIGSSLINNDFISINKFIILFVSCLITYICIDFKILAHAINNIVMLIAITSLFTYVLNNTYDIILTSSGYTNVNDMEYRGFFLNYVYPDFLKFRNIGLFWEPGIFANWLFIVLLLKKYKIVESTAVSSTILILTMITTFSFAGFIYLALILMMQIKNISYKSVLLLSIMLFAFINFYEAINLYFENRLNINNLSTSDRLNSLSALVKLGSDNIMTGVGWEEVIKYFSDKEISTMAGTPFILVASFGIFSLFVFYPLIIFFIRNMNLYLIIAFSIFLIKENHIFFSIFYLIIFYSFNLRKPTRYNV